MFVGGGNFAVLNNTSGCTPCPGVTGTLSGKVRVFFSSPIPIGIPTPTITTATIAGVTLLGYQFCFTNDAGSTVVRTYADYCIYIDPLIVPLLTPLPSTLPITFDTSSGMICTTPITVPCSSGFVILNSGGAFGGSPSEVACPAPTTCVATLVNVVSRLRVFFSPCLPAGVPAPTIIGAQGVDADGYLVTILTGPFCFVATAESNQLISTVRCYVDYCVYGAAGSSFNPPAQIQFTFDLGILSTINGVSTPITQTCSPSPGSSAIVLNPDVNVTYVNVSVSGNVNTNDVVPAGTTYGTPVPQLGNPAVATLNMNSDGTYTFITGTAGVYIYRVPVCPSGVVPPSCPTTELKITVLDNAVTNNPPVANTDIAATPINTAVIINVIANDKCSNPGCTLNPLVNVTVLPAVQPANGTAIANGDGTITYTPTTGFTGLDSLTYQVCDNAALCATAKVYITVVAIAPNTTSAADDYFITNLNAAVSGNVKPNDIDAEGNAQLVTTQTTTAPGMGTLVLNGDGSFTFTPVTGFTGPVNFVYTICDNGMPTVCANATLYILVSPVAVVPIILTDFKGLLNNQQVVLNWKTSTEINSSHFDVQRSLDGINFEKIGSVPAHGNSSAVNTYELTDKVPVEGVNYYRLKTVDLNGSFVYSSVVIIKIGNSIKGYITVNPNPAHGNIRLKFNGIEKGIYNVVLSNPLGKVQLSDQVTISQNAELRILKTQSKMAKGVYILHIYKDGINRISSIKVFIE